MGTRSATGRRPGQIRVPASRPGPRRRGALSQSIRITNLGAKGVTVGSDRKYAAIHQLGGTIEPKNPGGFLIFKVGGKTVRAKNVRIPARPFFPFLAGRMKHQRSAEGGRDGQAEDSGFVAQMSVDPRLATECLQNSFRSVPSSTYLWA